MGKRSSGSSERDTEGGLLSASDSRHRCGFRNHFLLARRGSSGPSGVQAWVQMSTGVGRPTSLPRPDLYDMPALQKQGGWPRHSIGTASEAAGLAVGTTQSGGVCAHGRSLRRHLTCHPSSQPATLHHPDRARGEHCTAHDHTIPCDRGSRSPSPTVAQPRRSHGWRVERRAPTPPRLTDPTVPSLPRASMCLRPALP